MSRLDKIHAVRAGEKQTLCGRNAADLIGALKTTDSTKVTCARCRSSKRWWTFFVEDFNRKSEA